MTAALLVNCVLAITRMSVLVCLHYCLRWAKPTCNYIIEGFRERTEHLDIFLFSAHHSK